MIYNCEIMDKADIIIRQFEDEITNAIFKQAQEGVISIQELELFAFRGVIPKAWLEVES